MSNPAIQGRHSTLNLADVHTFLTSGTPLADVAAEHGVSPNTLRTRLTKAGYRYDGTPQPDTQRPRIGSGSQGQVGAYIGGGDRPVKTVPWGSLGRGGEVA